MNYDKINEWLSSTVHNEYFFNNNTNDLSLIYKGYKSAVKDLEDIIKTMDPKTSTKDDYLEWVRTWREVYAKLSYESRMSKRARKIDDVHYVSVMNVRMLRYYARELLRIRFLSKEHARESYRLSKLGEKKVVDMADLSV